MTIIRGSLLDILIENHSDQEFEELLSRIESYLHYPDKDGLKKALNRTDTRHGNIELKKRVTALRNLHQWITILHFLFGVQLDMFSPYLSSKEMPQIKDNKNSTQERELSDLILEKTNPISTSRALRLDSTDVETQKMKMTEYVRLFHQFLEKLTSSLRLYDYVFRQSNYSKPDLVPYQKAHDRLYLKLEDMVLPIKKHNIKYIRYLVLPITSTFDDEQEKKKAELYYIKALQKKIIKHCSFNLFKHICRSLIKDPSLAGHNVDSGFRMIGTPTRNYHYGLMNGRDMFIEELSYYNSEKQCKPALLYVGSKEHYKEGVEMYGRELDRFFERNYPKFTLNHVLTSLTSLIKTTEGQIDTYEKIQQETPENKKYDARKLNKRRNQLLVLEQKKIFFEKEVLPYMQVAK